MAIYTKNLLGFGMPNFASPAQGSGARFGRYIPARSRLVRLRGLAGPWDGGEFASDEYYASVASQAGAATSLPPTGTIFTTQTTVGNTPVSVPAQGGGEAWVSPETLRAWAELINSGRTAVAQYQITQANIERAKNGQPLIDPRYLSPSAAVNFGLTPQAQQMLLIGGIALVGLMLLKGRGGKK